MKTLCLVRHGETEWHADERVAGRSDVALSANGQAEARAAGRYLSQLIEHTHDRCLLYTSPSPRDKRQSRMPSSA